MPEVLSLGDKRLSPKYWDKHSNKDLCSWFTFPASFYELRKKYGPERDRDLESLARRVSSELLAFQLIYKNPVIPLARFEQTFDPNSYPNGTLIRNTSEGLSLYGAESVYTTAEMFGLIVDPRGVPLSFKEEGNVVLYVVPNALLYYFPGVINVGEVQHTRHLYPSSTSTFQYERISRITKVEIIKMGAGQTQSTSQPGFSNPFPALAPQPQASS